MKREERHRMHRNELADWINKSIVQAKPYSKVILGGMVLAVLLLAGKKGWDAYSGTHSARAWEGVQRAWMEGRPSEMEAIVEQYPGTEASHFASVLAGNMYLSNGCDELFNNKTNAISELNKAVEHYRTVQEESKNPTLLAQAYYGLGRAYEALAGTRQSQGEVLEDAIAAYQQVVDRWPDGAYGKMAARRLKELSQQDTRAFYDKFAQWDPKPAFSDLPGMPGAPPPFDLKSLSDEGALPDVGRSMLFDEPETDQAAPDDESSSATDLAPKSAPDSATDSASDSATDSAPDSGTESATEPEKTGAAESDEPSAPDAATSEEPSGASPAAEKEPATTD